MKNRKIVFAAIDAASSLEAMLNVIIYHAIQQADYETVIDAKEKLFRSRLGLPLEETIGEDLKKKKELKREMNEAYRGGAETLRGKKRYADAAEMYLGAGMYLDALDMYLEDGTKESEIRAARIAVEHLKDYKLWLFLRVKQKWLRVAFDELERFVPENEKQSRGEQLARITHNKLVKDVKKEIRKKEGKTPKEKTLEELLKERFSLQNNFYDSFWSNMTVINPAIRYASKTSNPEVMDIGIDIYTFLKKMDIDGTNRQNQAKLGIAYLTAKKTGKPEDMEKLLNLGREKGKKEITDYPVLCCAIDVFMFQKQYDNALSLAKELGDCYIKRAKRKEILRAAGRTDELCKLYKDDPVAYALARAGK